MRSSVKSLTEIVLDGLINLGIDVKNWHGQGCNGAASVSGYIYGLFAHICKINGKTKTVKNDKTVKRYIPTAIVTALI